MFRLAIFIIFCFSFSLLDCPAQELRGFRLNSKSPRTKQRPTPPAAADDKAKLEVTSTPAEIPLELKILAEKGAESIAKQDWKTAKKYYYEMVLQAPDNPLAYSNLGIACYQLGDLTEAESNLEKSLDLNPNIATNWMSLGLIQFEKGEVLLSISSLTRAVHENPNLARAHMVLAAATYENGWTIAAIEELKKVITLEPQNSQAHFNLALTYASLSPPKKELARRHYFRAMDLGAIPSAEIERFLRTSPQ